MHIYREQRSGDYKYVDEINAVASGTTTFTDDVPSTSLGAVLDDDGSGLGRQLQLFRNIRQCEPRKPTDAAIDDRIRFAI